ncbi:glycosyltransferase [Liquorilactobacillus satsumensis]|nr:glycosyl transferase [Liquorilactobacillus satsumensis]MCP9356876.1 glycosyltransferase [Liquorilactobacillus satsumensis]MCP9370823.1 glycosyltransferase [Liquorilactobacillus satsumensis]
MSRKKRALYILAIIISALYLLWRIIFTVPLHTDIGTLMFALILVTCEIISNITAYILILFRIMHYKKEDTTCVSSYNLKDAYPSVDVLIVTHNEELELLRKTINAATFLEYPDKSKVNIVVCDDRDRSEVYQLANEYHVQYIGMRNNRNAKSGNINHALNHLKSPLFAIFDADMIPFSSFLESTVPIFLQNFERQKSKVKNVKPLGFVQTPQSFYNADIFQFNLFSEKIVVNEQDFFSRDVNLLNGYNKLALFTGSGALFLREAVDKVGGFPTDTLTEDFELGAKINIAGYESLATSKPQSSGITPINIRSVINQRKRWARGVIQSCRNMHIFVNPHISFLNRVILMNSYFYWWSFFRRLIYIAAPVLYAIFKVQIVNANFWILMLIWAPGYFLLHFVLGDGSSNIRNERWGEVQETFFAPYLTLPVILQSFGIKQKKFVVTSKKNNRSFFDKLYIVPYLILWSIVLFAIIKFNYGKWGSEIILGSVITFWLLMHFINLSFCLFTALARPIYRKNERFIRKVTGKISIKGLNEKYGIETCDVSEKGISFKITDSRVKLKTNTDFEGIIYYNMSSIHFSGKIIREIKNNELEIYAAKIYISGKDEKNHYLQLIYNGENRYLPREQDMWVTPLDELGLNLTMRIKSFKQGLHSLIVNWHKGS